MELPRPLIQYLTSDVCTEALYVREKDTWEIQGEPRITIRRKGNKLTFGFESIDYDYAELVMTRAQVSNHKNQMLHP